jgi:predicted small metal-binding protein
MNTMTCRQLGGPCDLALSGSTADEVIKSQDRHLREAVAAGDRTHEDALKDMKGRWRHPLAAMGWYRQVKRDHAALDAP